MAAALAAVAPYAGAATQLDAVYHPGPATLDLTLMLNGETFSDVLTLDFILQFDPSAVGLISVQKVLPAVQSLTEGADYTFMDGLPPSVSGETLPGYSFVTDPGPIGGPGSEPLIQWTFSVLPGGVKDLKFSATTFIDANDETLLREATVTTAAIPEPSTWVMLAVGLLGLAGWARRRA